LSLSCNVQDSKKIVEAVKFVVDKFWGLDGAANLTGYVGNQGLAGRDYAMDVVEDSD
jgi:hypothetical protein